MSSSFVSSVNLLSFQIRVSLAQESQDSRHIPYHPERHTNWHPLLKWYRIQKGLVQGFPRFGALTRIVVRRVVFHSLVQSELVPHRTKEQLVPKLKRHRTLRKAMFMERQGSEQWHTTWLVMSSSISSVNPLYPHPQRCGNEGNTTPTICCATVNVPSKKKINQN